MTNNGICSVSLLVTALGLTPWLMERLLIESI
jgi:hypothetical protein